MPADRHTESAPLFALLADVNAELPDLAGKPGSSRAARGLRATRGRRPCLNRHLGAAGAKELATARVWPTLVRLAEAPDGRAVSAGQLLGHAQ